MQPERYKSGRIKVVVQLLLLTFAGRLYASEEQTGAELTAMPLADAGYVMQVFLSLALVVVVIFALSYLIRKFDISAPRAEGPVRVLHSVAIGGKEQLLLVEVGEEQILVGRSPGHLSPIHKLEQPIAGLEGAGQSPGGVNPLGRLFHRTAS